MGGIHLKFARIFALLPLPNKQKSQRINGMVMIVLLVLIFAVDIYFRLQFYYKHVTILHTILDILMHTFTTLTNVSSILIGTFFYGKNWLMLTKPEKSTNGTNKYFFLLIFVFFIYVAFETNFYRRVDPVIIYYMIPTYVNIFLIIISVLTINYFADELTTTLVTFRGDLHRELVQLEEISQFETNPYIVSRLLSTKPRNPFFANFVEMSSRLDSFNKVYGWQILAFAAIVLLLTYESLNTALRQVFKADNTGINVELICIKTMKCSNFLIFGVLLILPCYRFNGEMDRVVGVCRKILINLPQISEKTFSYYLKLKLVFLLKQIEMKRPFFSAAGFFEVDYTMLVYILNGITSYLIVTLQAKSE